MNEPIVSQGGFLGRFGVVVHGGAGNVKPERRPRHAEGCLLAARAGLEVLRQGGSALDAAERAARALEDDTLFNAGTGACLDEEGRVAHDASIMEGRGLAAGAVCDLRGFANPIAIARAALDDGRHVLYAAEGAARFAKARGFVPVGDEALVTEAAREALAAAREGAVPMGWAGNTIGVVALDGRGLLAAATSTGGMVNKRVGRVGDSPIIGAGTYADDEAGAVSTTGHGEGMIRLCIARTAVEHMRMGLAAEEAVRRSIEHLRARIGSTGGAIAIDPRGHYGLSRSTASMSWAATWAEGEASGF